GRKVFREYLKSEYSEENILFWLACEDLKLESTPEGVEEKGGPKEVSLDARVREIINKNMVEPTAHTFDDAQVQIFTLMHRDSYPSCTNLVARLAIGPGGMEWMRIWMRWTMACLAFFMASIMRVCIWRICWKIRWWKGDGECMSGRARPMPCITDILAAWSDMPCSWNTRACSLHPTLQALSMSTSVMAPSVKPRLQDLRAHVVLVRTGRVAWLQAIEMHDPSMPSSIGLVLTASLQWHRKQSLPLRLATMAHFISLPPPEQFSTNTDQQNISKRWTVWADRFRDFIDASGITAETQKCKLLSYTAGREIAQIVKDLPDDKKDSLSNLLAALTAHFDERKSIVFARYQFRLCVQQTGEPVDAWYARLKAAAEACEFSTLKDSLIRDQIVATCCSDKLRRRLLQESNIALNDALRQARALEAAEEQATAMESSSSSIAAIHKSASNQRRDQPQPNGQRPTFASNTTCYRCGERGHSSCGAAKGKTCSSCGKPNHLAKACRQRRQQNSSSINVVANNTDGSSIYVSPDNLTEEAFTIQTPAASSGQRSANMRLQIEGKEFNVLVDSGASCKQHLQHIFSYGSSTPLQVLGLADLALRTDSDELQAPFFITKGSGITLLGRNTAFDMGILHIQQPARQINAVKPRDSAESSTLKKLLAKHDQNLDNDLQPDLRLGNILREFQPVFEGLGRVKDVEVDVRLRPEAVPVCHPPSRIPVHQRQAVIDELQLLLDEGIIERVHGPSPWVSRMVVVPKESGGIRICQDLRNVNSFAVPEKQPIPTFEEITDDMAGSTVFSELDITKAFHQIPVSPESRHLFTFSTPLGLMRLTRLSMGFTNASEVLQRVMTGVLSGLNGVSFNIIYQPGPQNPADVLSRQPQMQTTDNPGEVLDRQFINAIALGSTPQGLSFESIKQAARLDGVTQAAISALQTNQWTSNDHELRALACIRQELSAHDGVLLRGSSIIVPASLRRVVLQLAHKGHQCWRKTLDRLQTKVWWPGMRGDCQVFVQSCLACQATSPKTTNPPPLQPSQLPDGAWLVLGMDFYGPVQDKMLLVTTDLYSKFPEINIVSSTSAEAVLPHLKTLFSRYGIPQEIISDNGPPFNSAEFHNFLAEHGVKHRRICPLHPEANGATERVNRCVNKVVRAAIAEGRSWRSALDDWLLAYRVTPHSATGVAPAELLMGRTFNDTVPSARPSQPVYHHRTQLTQRHSAYTRAMARDFNRSRRAKACSVRPGTAVLRRRNQRTKTQTPFEVEPWTVVDRRGDSYVLQQGDRTCTRHLTHIRPLVAAEGAAANAEPTPPECGIAQRPHPRAAKDKPISYKD
uniref:CCHC-type domain-containing protein n=1 Tax=Macrostomum lignano TaxID=282301 RepID=A0A1I8GN44_9PLAT